MRPTTHAVRLLGAEQIDVDLLRSALPDGHLWSVHVTTLTTESQEILETAVTATTRRHWCSLRVSLVQRDDETGRATLQFGVTSVVGDALGRKSGAVEGFVALPLAGVTAYAAGARVADWLGPGSLPSVVAVTAVTVVVAAGAYLFWGVALSELADAPAWFAPKRWIRDLEAEVLERIRTNGQLVIQ